MHLGDDDCGLNGSGGGGGVTIKNNFEEMK